MDFDIFIEGLSEEIFGIKSKNKFESPRISKKWRKKNWFTFVPIQTDRRLILRFESQEKIHIRQENGRNYAVHSLAVTAAEKKEVYELCRGNEATKKQTLKLNIFIFCLTEQ